MSGHPTNDDFLAQSGLGATYPNDPSPGAWWYSGDHSNEAFYPSVSPSAAQAYQPIDAFNAASQLNETSTENYVPSYGMDASTEWGAPQFYEKTFLPAEAGSDEQWWGGDAPFATYMSDVYRPMSIEDTCPSGRHPHLPHAHQTGYNMAPYDEQQLLAGSTPDADSLLLNDTAIGPGISNCNIFPASQAEYLPTAVQMRHMDLQAALSHPAPEECPVSPSKGPDIGNVQSNDGYRFVGPQELVYRSFEKQGAGVLSLPDQTIQPDLPPYASRYDAHFDGLYEDTLTSPIHSRVVQSGLGDPSLTQHQAMSNTCPQTTFQTAESTGVINPYVYNQAERPMTTLPHYPDHPEGMLDFTVAQPLGVSDEPLRTYDEWQQLLLPPGDIRRGNAASALTKASERKQMGHACDSCRESDVKCPHGTGEKFKLRWKHRYQKDK